MHDDTLDRTTNGSGAVADMSLASLRQLNAAASWKGARPPEPIPTLEDVLDALPQNLWINLQIQAGEPIAAEVGEAVARADRSHQVVVAGGNRACRDARAANPQLVVCTLARQASRAAYVEHAARERAGFVQFHYLRGQLEPVHAERARALGMRVNYCCAPEVSRDELRALFEAGVDFVMVDDPDAGLEAARAVGLDAGVDTGIGPR